MKKEISPLSLLLPTDLYQYFELVDAHTTETDIHLFLDEKSAPPADGHYHSKGFTDEAVIHDFPLRGKPVYLHIRRRKWLELTTLKIVTNTYDLTHLGTQITNEFAAFLKDIYRE